jgi:hypothetical protein
VNVSAAVPNDSQLQVELNWALPVDNWRQHTRCVAQAIHAQHAETAVTIIRLVYQTPTDLFNGGFGDPRCLDRKLF